MHIVLGVLTFLGVVGLWIWRARMAAEAAQEIGDMAGDARGLVRGWLWRRRGIQSLADHIKEPSLAAAVMMCAVAQSDSLLSEREQAAIIEQMEGRMGIGRAEADELFARARWLTRDMKSLDAVLRQASGPILETCTAEEKAELIAMLTAVAQTEGEIDPLQQDAIERLQRKLFGA